MVKRESTEIAIIGAGIIGVCTALYLKQMGSEVTVIDRKNIGEEASGRNAGSLAVQNKDYGLLPLYKKGIQTWQELEDEVGALGFVQAGGIRVAETDEEAAFLLRDCCERNKYDLDVRSLTHQEIADLAPYLNPAVKGVNYCPWDAYVDARIATQRIGFAAAQKGVNFLTGTSVLTLAAAPGGFQLQTDSGSIRCKQLLLAAGPWTPQLALHLDLDVPIVQRINQTVVTPRLPRIIPHMITNAKGNLTLKQLDCGSILIGGGWQGEGSLEEDIQTPSYEGTVGNCRVAAGLIPPLSELDIIRTWAGFDSRTEDRLPIMGPIPRHEGAYLATSCIAGYVTGPYMGRLMAQLMHAGRAEMPLKPFWVSRFS